MSSPPVEAAGIRPATRLADGAVYWLQLLVLLVALFLVYARYTIWMVNWWGRSEYYGHGFLIPLISVYLIWRQRAQLRALPREDFKWGGWVTLGALVVHLVGTFIDVNFVSGFALVGTIIGLVWWLGGRHWASFLAFPVGFLCFMVPLDRMLIDKVAQPLQLFSAQLGGHAIAAIGAVLRIEGTMIITPVYTFEVAIPCSGLKSIIAMSALAALFAYLVEAPRWKKLALFAASVPVALLANAARIFVTVILGTTLGPALAEGFFHTASGALVFMLGVAGLFAVGRLLGCRQLRAGI